MSNFYLKHKSDNRKVVTRCGHGKMVTLLNGWNDGVKIICEKTCRGNKYSVFLTGGSNEPLNEQLLWEQTFIK